MADRNFDEALSGLDAGASTSTDSGAPRGAAADPSSHPTVPALREQFGDAVQHHTVMAGDEHVVYIAAEQIREVCTWLASEAGGRYDLLADLTAVDYGGGRPLEVVYQLWSTTGRRQLRLKATLPLSALEIDSVITIWQAANWLERETYDLFGIHFRGHPDLRRIMMPDNYAEGHPLRKDFPLRGRFSRAEQTRRALSMAVEDFYTPQELSVASPERVPGSTRSEPAADAGEKAAEPQDTAERPLGGRTAVTGTESSGAPAPGSVE